MWKDSFGNPKEPPPNYEPGDSKAFLDWMCQVDKPTLKESVKDTKQK